MAYLVGHDIDRVFLDLRAGAPLVGKAEHRANGPDGIDIPAGYCLILSAGMAAEHRHDSTWSPAANAGDGDEDKIVDCLWRAGVPLEQIPAVHAAVKAHAVATVASPRIWSAVTAVADLVLSRLGNGLVVTTSGADIVTVIELVLAPADREQLRAALFLRIESISAIRVLMPTGTSPGIVGAA